MLRSLAAAASILSALFWAVAWWAAHPLLSVGWCLLWGIVLLLDLHLHLDTAPPLPAPVVVVPERVEEGLEPVGVCSG
ncbi:MAG: hypothetical protein U5L04_09845 [Trueperaceae bacterium]|nr:hypothetical protein [Trueperaceae bacterium]